MFVTSFVLGSVFFKGKDILVNSNMFNRDVLLYIISLLHIILIGYRMKITLLDSFIFILIYSLNIICAFYQGRKKEEENKNNNNGSEENKIIIDEMGNGEQTNNNKTYKLGKEIELIIKRNSANDFYQEYMNVPLSQKQSSLNEQILGEVKEDILNSLKEQKMVAGNIFTITKFSHRIHIYFTKCEINRIYNLFFLLFFIYYTFIIFFIFILTRNIIFILIL